MIELVPVIIAVVGTAVCAYDDWKTSYLNEKLVYGLLIFGVLWTLLFSAAPFSVFVSTLAVFAVGFVAYAFGQIGGGDVFLFSALNLLIPEYPKALVPILESLGVSPVFGAPYPFIVPVFLLAGLLGPMLFFSLRYSVMLFRERRRIKGFNKKAFTALFYCALAVPLVWLWGAFSFGMALLFVPVITSFLILPFKSDILEKFCLERKSVSKLTDDDVIALEFMKDATKKKLGLWRKTLTAPEIRKVKALAKKYGVISVPVCENLPQFVPFIFISLLINLLVGDILLFMLVSF